MGDTAAFLGRKFDSGKAAQVKDVVEKFTMIPGGLIPALYEAQKLLGYLPHWVQEYMAEKFELPLSEVCSVISHYPMFSSKGLGECRTGVSKEAICCVKSTEEILRRIEKRLGNEGGDSKADCSYSIEVFRCSQECGSGLVMLITEYSRQSETCPLQPADTRGLLPGDRRRLFGNPQLAAGRR